MFKPSDKWKNTTTEIWRGRCLSPGPAAPFIRLFGGISITPNLPRAFTQTNESPAGSDSGGRQINPEPKPTNLHSTFTIVQSLNDVFGCVTLSYMWTKETIWLLIKQPKNILLCFVKISIRHLFLNRTASNHSTHPPYPTLPPLFHFPQTLHLSLPPTLCPPFPPCRVISPSFYIFPSLHFSPHRSH